MKFSYLRTLAVAVCFAVSLPSAGTAQSSVIAEGRYGRLTVDNANAYLSAAVFCLQQVYGYPFQPTAGQLQYYRGLLARHYPILSPEEQVNVANAQSIATQYGRSWQGLSLAVKRDFCYNVLAIAYPEPAVRYAIYGAPRQAAQGRRSSGGGMPSMPDHDIYNPDTGTYATPFGSTE